MTIVPFITIMCLVCIIVLFSFLLCCAVLLIIWKERKSDRYKTFFYRCWWNEGFINLFTFIYFMMTIYIRFFASTTPMFLYMNRFGWWTKFAEITQEHLMYIQIMNVFVTLAGRIGIVCFPHSHITAVVDGLNKWQLLALQILLPTLTVIPTYLLFDFQYRIEEAFEVPVLLISTNAHYNKVLFILGLSYRVFAFVLCVFGYMFLFWTVRKKANRNEANIMILCGCLLSAIAFEISYTIVFYHRHIGAYADYATMRLLCFTSMLWVPFTDIVVTILVIAPLRRSILSLLYKLIRRTPIHKLIDATSTTLK